VLLCYGVQSPARRDRDATAPLTDRAIRALADTAQAYRNEEEAGRAVRESGLARKDIYITTKYSGLDGLDIETSIHNSLKNVRPLLPPSLPPSQHHFFYRHHHSVACGMC
jgi:hypothetical protein